MTGTSAVLYYCKKRFLKPYLKLLALLGWRPFVEAPVNRFVPWLNHAYVALLLSILALGCALQYCACYR
jgi:ribosome biogenesis protein ENP2